ncbi:hypothetical protein C7T86_09905 [Xanthomonas citri pv. malvacearum]|uniref:Uncharacterized protein n=1 Tax=Xanthomonas campestris pv. malvacearum TaxID=86040 RepID=A0AA44Z1A2_XANCM|nr:hypothetical protein CIW71_09800 [Xanthomonas citri pv. malvacearum]PUE93883.1 hypothetical protein C7T86_09905 [Xanthomonas citri pv. malvacearum]
MNVDTTVQEKAIAYPTDSRLLDAARKKRLELGSSHSRSGSAGAPAISPLTSRPMPAHFLPGMLVEA